MKRKTDITNILTAIELEKFKLVGKIAYDSTMDTDVYVFINEKKKSAIKLELSNDAGEWIKDIKKEMR